LRIHYRLSWMFLNLVERVLFGFLVTGRERIPKTGAVIIASNHISYYDPPVVGSGVPREVYFLAKEELFQNRLFGWLISKYNAIPLRRSVGDVGAFKKAVALLRQGRAVLMFPEGTRSLTGKLLKPKPGVGMIAALTSSPVVPAYVRGTNRLRDVLLRKSRLEVIFGDPIVPSGRPGRGASGKDEYGAITQEIMRRIADLGQATRQEPQYHSE
jgi:1-acyl-sn-glycerol-3-phosphate acyltransferase